MKNWKIGTRITAGFGAVILIGLAHGGLGYARLAAMDKSAKAVTNDSLAGIYLVGQIQRNVPLSLSLLLEHLASTSKEEKAQLEAKINEVKARNGKLVADYEPTVFTQKDRDTFDAVKAARAAYWPKVFEIVALSSSGQSRKAADLLDTQLKPLYQAYADATEAGVAQNKATGDANAQEIQASVSGAKLTALLSLLAAFAVSGTISVLVARSIVGPLTHTVAQLGDIAKGDLSKDAPADFQARADEIGMLARAQQTMLLSLRAMIREISGGIQVLSSSSTELLASSAQMTSGSRNASDRAHSAAAAAEEMSSNVTSVAAGMEQATTNLANVSLATDQMTSTIGEIAGNSEKARRITADATRQAARITEQINQLGQAAREIGKVTETITEISSQTNLLALNATIEAARAGSAGKGFAVVATEIKALAQQTAAATEDIKTRIAGVQSATSGGIAEIEKISHVIEEVSAIVTTIAAAIEEQAVATKDIARNISEASLGVTDANARVSETSHVSRGIAKDIGAVDHAAGEMASGSDHVRSSATELSSVAEQLKVTAARFHV
jgi:methyl-accepting chemotaxis protein